ncbi:MAG: rod shape-determining protein MreC [Candidatus Magasanikbacteria bacterium]|nr:rod shape-determining protein MreC [Candidatus Magasanikbacteria bacterium]
MRFRSKKHVRWYIAGALFVVFLHIVGALPPLERRARTIIDMPITFLFDRVQFVRTALTRWKEKQDAEILLPQVTRERDLLATRIALVEADNAGLRREMQYPVRTTWTTIGADVISKTTDIAQQALIINRGSSSGVALHQIVFTEQGILVGEVISVQSDRASIRLTNDSESRIGVLLAKNSHVVGIVEGGYGLGVRLSLIPPQEVVSEGDLIVTNDVTEFMPRGLLIGRATTV